MGNHIYIPIVLDGIEGTARREIPCDAGLVSDGYHTFNELYEHRCLLFCLIIEALGRAPFKGDWDIWKARKHHDGTSIDGWFIAGATPKYGDLKTITYHLLDSMWDFIKSAPELGQAPKWDGHTSQDVIERLKEWLGK